MKVTLLGYNIMVDKLTVTGGQEVRANMWVYIRDVIDEKCSHNNY